MLAAWAVAGLVAAIATFRWEPHRPTQRRPARAPRQARPDDASPHQASDADARAIAAHGQHSSVGKILEIHQGLPGRIHIVLIRQVVGF